MKQHDDFGSDDFFILEEVNEEKESQSQRRNQGGEKCGCCLVFLIVGLASAFEWLWS